jgi:hypothetical protein
MSDKLQGLLLGYIRENNPDLLQQLDEDDSLHAWVIEKIREVELVLQQSKALPDAEFLDLMTVDLKPSKYNYVRDLLEDEFPDDYERLKESGMLRYEIIHLIHLCSYYFETMPVAQDPDENRQLDYAVSGMITDYFAGVIE